MVVLLVLFKHNVIHNILQLVIQKYFKYLVELHRPKNYSELVVKE